MAAPTTVAVTPETPITIKITVNDVTKKLKLPLRDLGATVLPMKVRQLLDVKPDDTFLLERYSDSSGGYIVLDETNPQVFKTLIRAAKAKLKLRLRATVTRITAPVTASAETASLTQSADAATPDNRNIGSGIFQFRDARASTSQQPLINFDDAQETPSIVEQARSQEKLAIRPKEILPHARFPLRPCQSAWSVYCNNCDKAMSNEHFHCGICDGGDYDLCVECVEAGKVCPGSEHWLVKRFIVDGKVETSTTERVVRKAPSVPAIAPAPIVAVVEPETKTLAEEPRMDTRTCNSCVVVLPDRDFVTCTTCPDFDLCIPCHAADQHGHHPAHGFEPAVDGVILSASSNAKLAPGRGVRHNALCDACDKNIVGVRHKCLHCPDWDYCSACVPLASQRHAGAEHRFVAIYDPLPDVRRSEPLPMHTGVRCDGPLCSVEGAAPQYIAGVRYKCTICHDLDFCAACEAHPSNKHNQTHPLLKMRTPVRGVSVRTQNEVVGGDVRVLGDRMRCGRAASATTQVQTVAEIKPIPLPVDVKQEEVEEKGAEKEADKAEKLVPASSALTACFLHDTIPDGTSLPPNTRFAQRWTLKNPGPSSWPAGCSVRYVGGDNMLAIDSHRPGPTSALAAAAESNIIARTVLPGEEVAFQIMLKTPTREGRAISYWRVKTPLGEPFGHRLWCDVVVKSVTPQSLPQTSQPIYTPLGTWAPCMPKYHPPTSLINPSMSPAPTAQCERPAFPRNPCTLPEQQIQDRALPVAIQQREQALREATREQQRQKMQQYATEHYARRHPEALLQRTAAEQQMRQQRLEAYKNGNGLAFDEAQMSFNPRDLPNLMQSDAALEQQRLQQALFTHFERQHGQAARMQQAQRQQEAQRQHMAQMQRARMQQAAQVQQAQMQQEFRNFGRQCPGMTLSPPVPVSSPHPQVSYSAASSSAIPISALLSSPLPDANKPEEQKKPETTTTVPVPVSNDEEPLQRSTMVFPKLDKESPSSSTYQSFTEASNSADVMSKAKAAYVENEKGEIEEVAAVAAPADAAADPALLDEEIEVLSANDEDEYDSELDGEGFATDEEYDILDASDEETVA